MPFDPYMQKALLDWCLGGATPTRPTNWFIGFETTSPTSVSDFAAPGSRATATFQSASTGVSASASLKAALTCTMTAACTVIGWAVYNSSSGGQRLMYGTLTASQTCASGDAPAFVAANLKITLA